MTEEFLKMIRNEAKKEIVGLKKYNEYAKLRNQLAEQEEIKKELGLSDRGDLWLPEKNEEDIIKSIYQKHIGEIEEEDTNEIYYYDGTYKYVYDSYSGYCNGFRGELGEAIYQKYYKNKIIPLFNNLVIKDIGIIIPSKKLEMPLKIHALSENHYVINDSNYYDELLIEEIKNRHIYKITRRNNDGVGINYVDNVDASFAFVKFRKDYISHLVDEIIGKINQEINDEMIYNSECQSNSLKKTKK